MYVRTILLIGMPFKVVWRLSHKKLDIFPLVAYTEMRMILK